MSSAWAGQVGFARNPLGQRRAAEAAEAAALGQMDFEESAMPAAQLAEGVERLDDARAFGPAAADSAGEGDHGGQAGGERVHS